MEPSSQPSRHLPARFVWWSLALVMACGLLLGYYIMRIYVDPLPRQYQLDFGHAQWIEPPDFAPVAYFRKDIFLSAAPEQAWLEVSASDNYKCIVNGRTVGNESSVKTRVAGIYDIKKRLKPGINVIAVTISRTSFPGSAQLLVRGFVKEPGKVTSLVSDGSWKVTAMTGIVEGSEEWDSPLVDDQVWPNARLSVIEEHPIRIRWVDLNPQILQLMPSGNWLLAENAASEAVFTKSINADRSRQETWIEVASSGDLDLLVNGQLVTPAIATSTGGKQLPHLAPTTNENLEIRKAEHPGETITRPSHFEPTTLEAYDISRWIKKGPNSIVVTVRAEHRPASLFADGFVVQGDGTLLRFKTDSDWQAGGVSTTQEAAEGHRAVEAGSYGSAPWGYLPQELARPVDYPFVATMAKSLAALLITMLVTVGIWLLASALVTTFKGEPFQRAMSRDALFHAPVAVALVLLLLPGYDPRFPQDWPFHLPIVVGAVLVLLGLRYFHFLPAKRATAYFQEQITALREITFPEVVPYLLLFFIMTLGFALRYAGHEFMSFDHDEMGLITKSKGIFKLGFPYTEFAGEVRPLTTYELVPYPLALFGGIFGYTEWGLRLPSCLMGTLTIGIMALFGRRLFNWRTGLIAAFIYACIPLDIRWAQNAFYPQQCQFMAMLTAWFFYEAARVRPFHRGYLTAATVAFCATYLSWEGSAFLLPALIIGLLVIRWGEWWWFKEFHLYRCLFFIATVVIAEYCYRTLAGFPYLQIGSGLSNLTGPSLFFLTTAYQPMYYVNKLLLSENHVFFTIMLVLGLIFCWSNRGFRYVSSLLITLVICHTNFLAALAPRYCYYYQAFLVLSGVGVAVLLYDRLVLLAEQADYSTITQSFAHVAGVGLIVLLFVQSNEWILKEYMLASESDTPGLMTRLNTYRYDYRGAAQYVKSHLQPGDIVLPGIPHVYEYYSGKPGDYFLNTLLGSKVPYNQKLDEPGFVDKFSGLPVLRNLTELLEVTHRGRRTWLIFAPYSSFDRLNDPAVLDYVHKNAKTMFESYRAKVLLVEGANKSPSVAQSP